MLNTDFIFLTSLVSLSSCFTSPLFRPFTLLLIRHDSFAVLYTRLHNCLSVTLGSTNLVSMKLSSFCFVFVWDIVSMNFFLQSSFHINFLLRVKLCSGSRSSTNWVFPVLKHSFTQRKSLLALLNFLGLF